MAKKGVHVVPHKDGWATKTEGAGRVGGVYNTQREAIDRARGQAQRERVEVVIHRQHGQIRDSDSYGKDPMPPMVKKDLHVMPSTGSGWAVLSTGAERASKVFSTQEAAVKHARQRARKDQTELYVHKQDGTIRDRDSYSNHPNPPKDKK